MVPLFHKTLELVLPNLSPCQMHDYIINCNLSFTKWSELWLLKLWVLKMTFEDIKLSLQVITQVIKINFIYLAYHVTESEGRFWRLKSSRSLDRQAELAVFTGCSSGAVCFTSYLQCVQSEIFEDPNSKYVNMVIILNLNIYCRQENCTVLG